MPCTAETLAEFVSAMADRGYAPASLRRMMAAVRSLHRLAARPMPDGAPARAVIKCYRNERAAAGIANTGPRALALWAQQLRELVAACVFPGAPGWPPRSAATAARDRLVLVLGWAMMARRGELRALDLQNVAQVEHGWRCWCAVPRTISRPRATLSRCLTAVIRRRVRCCCGGLGLGCSPIRGSPRGRCFAGFTDLAASVIACPGSRSTTSSMTPPNGPGWAVPTSGRIACGPGVRPEPIWAARMRC
ncbi:hypothetical protein ACFWYW_58060 [Nonomuraea sp. NPDC059023]|uniref:hypothetical protein n=1 Tax=unclassified Nonomuraea TaxID=2593643 RepID=UPI00368F8F75